MSNKSFKFKQFEVFHDRTAMKVGTDGVLLGAWSDFNQSSSILDVGTGTGLIALMAAQKNQLADITGVELNEDAAQQAKENVSNSIFKDRIKILNRSFQLHTKANTEKYDLLVANPPFFTASLQSPDDARTHARHSDTLSIEELLSESRKVLAADGRLSFIYPFDELETVEKYIGLYSWHLLRRCDVYPTIKSNYPKRVLFELSISKTGDKEQYSSFCIESDRHVYTAEYIQLTKDFYLKM